MNIAETLSTISQMHADGVIGKYALGGAVGASFYIEPAETEDVDVFVALKTLPGTSLISLSPIYEYLRRRGHHIQGQYIVISDWPVQFLAPDSPLVEEALEQAAKRDFGGVDVFVFTAEHLMAIALKLGRAKDRVRLLQFLETSSFPTPKFDASLLNGILERHGLADRWAEFVRQISRPL